MVNKKEKGGARLWMRLFAYGKAQSIMHADNTTAYPGV